MLTAQEELQLATFHLWIKRQICKIQASSRQLWSQQLNWIKDHQAICIVSAEEWVFNSCLYQMPLKLTQHAISTNLGNPYCKKHTYATWFCSACVFTKQLVLLLNIVWIHYASYTLLQSMNSILFKWQYSQIPHCGLPMRTHPWEQKHPHQKQM